MPQCTFRAPSTSALDRATNDPTADPTTTHINFVWKKEGRLTNSLVCYLTGRSTDSNSKKKGGKEPDVPIAFLDHYKDLTIYESNYHRVEMEDYKGLEVTLILTAATIRDVYCGHRKDCFNSGESPRKNSSGGGLLGRKKSSPALATPANTPPPIPSPALPPRPGGSSHHSQPNVPHSRPFLHANSTTPNLRPNSTPPRPSASAPPPDPRAQWEIDAETARLRKATENEARIAEARRREQQKADEAERKRLKKIVDQEGREKRKKQEEIDKETERLRRKYGDQSSLYVPLANAGRGGEYRPSGGSSNYGPPRPSSAGANPYGRGAGLGASMSSFFHGQPGISGTATAYPGGQQQPTQQAPVPKKRKSFFGLRGLSEEDARGQRLSPKKSTIW
jgi:hypothetical protein